VSCLKRGINKKHFYSYISPICPEDPHKRIFVKFYTAVEVVDVITCDIFEIFSDQLRDVDSVGEGVKNEGFPLTKPMVVNTGRGVDPYETAGTYPPNIYAGGTSML